eukprot:CAMPEP_0170173638 /NCGR_PEP_ID=MMETSP0040_2-20121228/6922_1 /TAXON_ID=641309 /ORGANISM="Lotharella oceanica, Strain CCMP622" /LENGTH=40 /DNA_ID= /DNA_START= /DNA_END= /DNA_ORIENTATION=
MAASASAAAASSGAAMDVALCPGQDVNEAARHATMRDTRA